VNFNEATDRIRTITAGKELWLPSGVFALIVILLSFVQLKVENPMLLLERFVPGGGWAELIIVGIYGAVVAYHMQDTRKVAEWRKYTWLLFSLIFFAQLGLGLLGNERFLMTGKLHLPVPMMILAGPVYRGHISVMTVLFISTVVLSGPAWCSHLCYFGAMDSMAAGNRTRKRKRTPATGSRQKYAAGPMKGKWAIKPTVILLVVAVAIILRWLEIPLHITTLLAAGFGILGLALILLVSRRQSRMFHCIVYCPIGTIVNLTRSVNPFRMYIDHGLCTDCMACTRICKYDALNVGDVKARMPGTGCTLCGDCLGECHSGAIRYGFLKLSPAAARNLYLLITISLHASTLALARI